MSSLKQLQHEFQEYILTGKFQPFGDKVVDIEPVRAKTRMEAYYDAYRLRLIEVLEIDFPKVQTLLGGEKFDKACRDYIDAYPSHHFSVRYYGRYFAKFLAKTQPYSEHMVLSEMADFEWAIMESLDAQDGKIADITELHAIKPENWFNLVFKFHPSVHTRTYNWDVKELWKAIEENAAPRPPEKLKSPLSWLFWRRGLESCFESMTPAHIALYRGIQNGENFSQLCENLLEFVAEEEIPPTVLGILQHWIQQGIIGNISEP